MREPSPERCEAMRVKILSAVAEEWRLNSDQAATMMRFDLDAALDLFAVYDLVSGMLPGQDADWVRESVGTNKGEPWPPMLDQILAGDVKTALHRMKHAAGHDGSWGGFDFA